MLQKILVPIIEKKLYFLADSNPPKDLANAFYFNIDNDLTYEAFYQDFGPLNIQMVWKYVKEVERSLFDPEYEKFVFYHYTSPHYKTCCNSVLLICAFQMLCLNKSSEQAYKPFEKFQFTPYRDASYGKCSYKCTILDCLGGLEYAMKLGWFDLKTFNLTEYEHFDQLQNGDLNVVVPQKLIAFSSPSDSTQSRLAVNSLQNQNQSLHPKDYVPIFKRLNVKTVVRLNSATYEKSTFTKNGIQHHDLYFPDGASPSLQIVEKFLNIVQSSQGAVAVHCKAGLGRTGCLIACHAIKNYQFPAALFIGWIRLCRPGSILGPQQHFLIQNEHLLHQKGESSQVWKQLCQKLSQNDLERIRSLKNLDNKQIEMNGNESEIHINGDKGQGSRLVQAKNNHYQTKNKINFN